jgi:drug/metabolite transporter (DMT)-like permease
MNDTPRQFPRWGILALSLAVAGNVLACLPDIYSLSQIPPGTGVRLMIEAGISFLISFATIVVVLPLAIASLRKERFRLFAVGSLGLSLTPFFFSGFVMRWYAGMRGVILEP